MNVEGQGLGGVDNRDLETTAQRHQRWRDLRDHLRDVGVHGKPPDHLLIAPGPHTRPDVRLMAYYDEVKHESKGKKTTSEMVTTCLAVVLGVRVLSGFDRWFDDTEQSLTFGWLFLTLAMLAITYTVIGWVLREIRSRKASLSLTLEELSLSLPDGNRHASWRDVYSVSVIQGRKRLSRRKPYVRGAVKPCIRVELNDGVVANTTVVNIGYDGRASVPPLESSHVRGSRCTSGARPRPRGPGHDRHLAGPSGGRGQPPGAGPGHGPHAAAGPGLPGRPAGGAERKNGWQLAEANGDADPYGIQYLLSVVRAASLPPPDPQKKPAGPGSLAAFRRARGLAGG